MQSNQSLDRTANSAGPIGGVHRAAGQLNRYPAKPHVVRMPEQNTYFPWSVELASGWVSVARVDDDVTDCSEFMAIIPCNQDALLRLSTYDPDAHGIEAAQQG